MRKFHLKITSSINYIQLLVWEMLDTIIIFHILGQNIDLKIIFSKKNPKIFNKLIIIKEIINHKLNKNLFL